MHSPGLRRIIERHKAAGIESGGVEDRPSVRSVFDGVDPLVPDLLAGYDQPVFLRQGAARAQHGPGGVLPPSNGGHDLPSVVPPSRLSIAITWLVFLPSLGAPASFAGAATGAFFFTGSLLLRGRVRRRHVGRRGATGVAGAGSFDSGTTASGWAVSLASCSGTGAGSSATGAEWSRLWIAFQMRVTAVARSLNLRNGVSLGRLL